MSYLTPAALTAFRETERATQAMVVAVAVGLVATWLHPIGLAVGGVLLGLLARSLSESVVLAVEFGVTVLLAWAIVLVWYGTLGAVVTAVPLIYIAVVGALAVPTLAAVAVRGVV